MKLSGENQLVKVGRICNETLKLAFSIIKIKYFKQLQPVENFCTLGPRCELTGVIFSKQLNKIIKEKMDLLVTGRSN